MNRITVNDVIRVVLLIILISCDKSTQWAGTVPIEPTNSWELIVYSEDPGEKTLKYAVSQGTWSNRTLVFTDFASITLDLQEPQGFYFGEWLYIEERHVLQLKVPVYNYRMSYILRLNGEKVSEQILTNQPRYEYLTVGGNK